ncbi:MAG TPA: antibiotic biosynthesis monooxygenase [Candidatus Stackebrandtia excrementipullorum]|nr:antibiotic biosynthesis monooxygenase [Candidatus Stackebrandtia excrementipullorum]
MKLVEDDVGPLEYTYYVDIDDDRRFICVEVWRDRQSKHAHLAAPHMNAPGAFRRLHRHLRGICVRR